MNNEIKVNKANKSITFINNGIGFSQFGVADEILDLITNLQEKNNELKKKIKFNEKTRRKMQQSLMEQIEQLKEEMKTLYKYTPEEGFRLVGDKDVKD